MPQYLLIRNGVVQNRVIALPDWADAQDAAGVWDYVIDVQTVVGVDPGPGWAYDGSTFTPPAAPVEGPVRVIPFLDFMRRWERPERNGLRQAMKTNQNIEDFVMMLQLAGVVDLDDQDVIDRLNQAETAGILGPGRAAEIRA